MVGVPISSRLCQFSNESQSVCIYNASQLSQTIQRLEIVHKSLWQHESFYLFRISTTLWYLELSFNVQFYSLTHCEDPKLNGNPVIFGARETVPKVFDTLIHSCLFKLNEFSIGPATIEMNLAPRPLSK